MTDYQHKSVDYQHKSVDYQHKPMTALALAAQRGDQGAISELFGYGGQVVRLVRVATKRCRFGARNNEELRCEIVAQAWEKLALFDPARGEFTTWIFSVSRGMVWRYLTKRRRKQMARIPDNGANIVSGAPSPPAEVMAEELTEALEQAIAALPAREAEVVRCRLAGQNLRIISESVGVSKERARQIQESAYARLRRHAKLNEVWSGKPT